MCDAIEMSNSLVDLRDALQLLGDAVADARHQLTDFGNGRQRIKRYDRNYAIDQIESTTPGTPLIGAWALLPV